MQRSKSVRDALLNPEAKTMKRWMCVAALASAVLVTGCKGCNGCDQKQECQSLMALCRIDACLATASHDWCAQQQNEGKCERQGSGFVIKAEFLSEFMDACLALAAKCGPENTAGCTIAERLGQCIKCDGDGSQTRPPDAAPPPDASCGSETCEDGTCCAGGTCCGGACCKGVCCSGTCCPGLVCGAAPNCRCLDPGEVCEPPPPPDAATTSADSGPGPSCPVDMECCRNADCDGDKCCYDPGANTTICASSCPAPKVECTTGLTSCALGSCPCH